MRHNEMIRKKVKIGLAGTLVTLMITLSLGMAQAGDQKYIVFGSSMALTGPGAPWGLPFYNGWTMIFDEWNEAGGSIINGERYYWKLAMYDDGFEPQKTVANVNRLINRDNCSYMALLGPDSVAAVQPITERQKTILFGYSSMAPNIMNKEVRYTVVYGLDNITVIHFYPWLVKKDPLIKKVAIYGEDNLNGENNIWSNTKAAELAGLEIVFSETGDPEATDFYPVLNRILDRKPDFIMNENVTPSAVAMMIKQARELGFKGGFHLCTPDEKLLREVAGWDNCEGVYLDPYLVDAPQDLLDFERKYKDRFGESAWPGFFGLLCRDQVQWLRQAIEATQSLNTDDIIKYWETTDQLKSQMGSPVYLGGEKLFGVKRVFVYPMWFAQIQNGKFVQVIADAFDPIFD